MSDRQRVTGRQTGLRLGVAVLTITILSGSSGCTIGYRGYDTSGRREIKREEIERRQTRETFHLTTKLDAGSLFVCATSTREFEITERITYARTRDTKSRNPFLYVIGDLFVDPVCVLWWWSFKYVTDRKAKRDSDPNTQPDSTAGWLVKGLFAAPFLWFFSPIAVIVDVLDETECENHGSAHIGSFVFEPLATLLPFVSNEYDWVISRSSDVTSEPTFEEIEPRAVTEKSTPAVGRWVRIETASGLSLSAGSTGEEGAFACDLRTCVDVLSVEGDTLQVSCEGQSQQVRLTKADIARLRAGL